MQTLYYGSAANEVSLLQLALKRAGTYDGEITGEFGKSTLRSLMQFQRFNSLPADGIAGDMTWAKLMAYLYGYISYTVRYGDTFYNLAKRYSTTIQAIITANPDIDALNLQVGQKLIIPLDFNVIATDIEYTTLYLDVAINGLSARYPFIKTESIGKSVMGKDIYCLKIGNGSKRLMYNAEHHANEWITTPLLLKFAEEYAAAYASNEKLQNYNAKEFFENSTLYIVPAVNPDGLDLVNDAIDKNSNYYNEAEQIAQNYPSIPFSAGWKANIAGTDLNLNYPTGWENAKKIKYELGFTSPAPRDFVGTMPLSAPESKAMYIFTQDNNFLLTISYHTQGEVIYWKYLDYLPMYSYEIAQEFARASGYAIEKTPVESGYAGYKDWYIQTYNRPGYTIEAGNGINPLPISQFNKIYKDNKGIMVLGIAKTIELLR